VPSRGTAGKAAGRAKPAQPAPTPKPRRKG
jgi:hypothetical protein